MQITAQVYLKCQYNGMLVLIAIVSVVLFYNVNSNKDKKHDIVINVKYNKIIYIITKTNMTPWP